MKSFIISILISSFSAKLFFDGLAVSRILLFSILVFIANSRRNLMIPKNVIFVLLLVPILVLMPKGSQDLFIQTSLVALLIMLSQSFSYSFRDVQICLTFLRKMLLLFAGSVIFFVLFPSLIPELFLAVTSDYTMKDNLVKSRYIVPSLNFNNPRMLARFLLIGYIVYLSAFFLNQNKKVNISAADYISIFLTLIAIMFLGRRSILILALLSTLLFFILSARVIMLSSFSIISAFLVAFLILKTNVGKLLLQIFVDLDANQIAHRLFDVFSFRVEEAFQNPSYNGLFSGLVSNEVRSKSMEVGLETLINELGYFSFLILFLFFFTSAYRLVRLTLASKRFGLFIMINWFLIMMFFLLQKGQILYSFELITFFILIPLFIPKYFQKYELNADK